MIRRIVLGIAATFAALAMNAQVSKEYILENALDARSIYSPYPGPQGEFTPAPEGYEAWADFIVTPMGSNIQFIFYRHAKTGAIIVKVLHNEKESTLPIKTDIFPYYHWEDVSSYFDSLIK